MLLVQGVIDLAEVLKLIIPGRPTTKKNSGRVITRGRYPRILPSKAFENYEKVSLMHIRAAMPCQFREPVALKCLYYLPDKRWWPDLVGLLQATSDILETAGVLENDRLIIGYDGSKIAGLDKHNPRAEIEIRTFKNMDQVFDPFVEKKKIQSLF